jgi:hypothetical protein
MIHRVKCIFRTVLAICCVVLCVHSLPAADAAAPTPPRKEAPFTPGGQWRAHDMARPRPRQVDPGAPLGAEPIAPPPSDAIVLFDGKDLSAWQTRRRPEKGKPEVLSQPRWKVEHGYMEIAPKSGSLISKERFGDCQIHLEWATPADVRGSGQGRGNSGVILAGHGEIQVLDSWGNDTYPDGQAAAIYGKYPPLVNASRRPGQWQTYDILFEAPRLDAQGQLLRAARLTVFHNGLLVHHALDTGGRSRDFQIVLQDHNTPVRYRNIWLRKLAGYDEP